MVAFPIVERELRVAARKRSTYFLRLAAVVLAGVLSLWFFFTKGMQWQQTGMPLFQVIVGVTFFAALSAGMFTTADCLSSEKRQGTLGLLFLTNVRAYQVVIGKLAATSLNAAYGLVAVLPLLALPVLIGGVTAGDVLGAAGLLGLCLFLSLSMGMLVSALCETEFEAVLGTFLALIILCVLPFLVATVLDRMPNATGLPEMFRSLSPIHLLAASLSHQANPFLKVFNSYLLLVAIGVGALLLSGRLVQHSFRSHGGSSAGVMRKLAERFRRRPRASREVAALTRPVNSERLRGYRSELLDDNPLVWLVNREPLRVKYVWGILGLFLVIWILGYLLAPRLWLQWETTAFFVLFLNGSLKLLLAAEAPRQLAEDRKSGSLELILSTPLSEREVLWGYNLAIFRQFAGPIALVVVLELLLLYVGYPISINTSRSHGYFTVACIVILVSDAVTLGGVGIWQGLRMQVAARAAWVGVFWTVMVPWLVAIPVGVYWTSDVLVSYHYYGQTWYSHSPRFNAPGFDKLWLIWLFAVLIYNHFLARRARNRLADSFRRLAAEAHSGNA